MKWVKKLNGVKTVNGKVKQFDVLNDKKYRSSKKSYHGDAKRPGEEKSRRDYK